jgi:hypothetical protein
MARLLKAGRAARVAEHEPESGDPDGLPYPLPPPWFSRVNESARRRWVVQNWPDLCRLDPEEADAAIQDRLAEIRARK